MKRKTNDRVNQRTTNITASKIKDARQHTRPLLLEPQLRRAAYKGLKQAISAEINTWRT